VKRILRARGKGTTDEVIDIVQHAYLICLVHNAKKTASIAALDRFVFGVARRLAFVQRKRSRIVARYASDLALCEENLRHAGGEGQALGPILADAFKTWLGRASPLERALVEEVYFACRPLAEAARRLGLSRQQGRTIARQLAVALRGEQK
jgi:DNA-directed RNA polymerase specialized sigma24 family protein